MSKKSRGTLVMIGGREEKEKEAERAILRKVAEKALAGTGRLLVVTAATAHPKEVAAGYISVFGDLGVPKVEVLDVRSRRDAYDESNVARLNGVSVVFFTGGDQLRITSQMGNSPVLTRMRVLYETEGVTIAGTSAGAAAMPETMLIYGPGFETAAISAIGMAPGLGLIRGVAIDSHFAERGRFGRLLGVVAENPRNLGLGIDEDTAIVADPNDTFQVIGSGAVYVVDGADISYSSLSEAHLEGIVSIFDVKLHVLRAGDRFDLKARRPLHPREMPIEAAA